MTRLALPVLTALIVLLLLSLPASAGQYCGLNLGETGLPTFGPEAPYMVAPSRNFDTIHTRLDLDIDVAGQTVSGSVTHTLEALRSEVDRIELNCIDMVVTGVELAGLDSPAATALPAVASWSQYEALNEDNNSLIINIAPPLKYGQQFDLRIEYHGHPTYGMFFIAEEDGSDGNRLEVWTQGEGQNNRHWIPGFDYPSDKATFEGIFRVPEGMFALSNGQLVAARMDGVDARALDGGPSEWEFQPLGPGETHTPGARTEGVNEYHWYLDTPQVSYLIMLAVSEYEIYQEHWGKIPLLYLVPPGTGAETVQRCYGKTPDMLDFFTDTIGIDYPFKKYAQVVVQDFIVGGMENTTAVVMNQRSLYDDRVPLTRDADSLIAHEMVHMWWGDMVTLREWNDMWLNEGFATYYEKLWLQHDKGDDAFRLAMFATHEDLCGRDDRDPRPMVVDFFNRDGWRSNSNPYVKGSSVLHMLRHQLGDELFSEVVRTYGNAHMYGFAETADLMQAVKEVTGENMDWFFEQWVYMAGHPKLEVSQKYDNGTGELTLTVKQTQEVKDLVPLFRLPIDVEVTTDEGVQLFSIVVDKAEEQFHFHVTAEPRMVIFDKGDWTLKTLTFNKNKAELVYQLQHGDAVSRLRAVRALDNYRNDADVLQALSEVVHGDDDYVIRQNAIGLYTSFPTDQTVELLLSALNSDEARVRLTAAERSAHAKNRQQVEDKLLEMLDSEPSYTIRAGCVDSLVSMGSKQALDACLNAISQDSDRGEVRNAGLRGLNRLGNSGHLELVEPYCTAGNSRWYRHDAIRTYAALAKKSDDAAVHTAAAEFIEAMLTDNWFRTRSSLIGSLESLGEKRSVEVLREFALSEPLSWVSDEALQAADRIESIRDPQVTIDDLETRLKGLQDELDRLQRRLDELDRRVGD